MRHGERLAHGPSPFSPPHLHPNLEGLGWVSQGMLKFGMSQGREAARC